MLHIRVLTDNDWQSWKKIRLEAVKQVPEAFSSSYEEESMQPDNIFKETLTHNTIYGAFDDAELVGCMALAVEKAYKKKHQGLIWGVYIQPAYRGEKVGDALLQAVILHAKTFLKQLKLSAHSENHAALRLYQRHGFIPYGTEPRATLLGDRYYDECFMMLMLDHA